MIISLKKYVYKEMQKLKRIDNKNICKLIGVIHVVKKI